MKQPRDPLLPYFGILGAALGIVLGLLIFRAVM